MRPVAETVVVQASPGRLFTHLVALWEAGQPLSPDRTAARRPPTDRMGDGFRVVCPATPWALPVDAELVVTSYRPPIGWRAGSDDPAVLWETALSPVPGDRTRLTCRIAYRARDPAGWLRELVRGRRQRARTLRWLLRGWRDEAERQVVLHRLRTATGRHRREPSEDTDSTR